MFGTQSGGLVRELKIQLRTLCIKLVKTCYFISPLELLIFNSNFAILVLIPTKKTLMEFCLHRGLFLLY